MSTPRCLTPRSRDATKRSADVHKSFFGESNIFAPADGEAQNSYGQDVDNSNMTKMRAAVGHVNESEYFLSLRSETIRSREGGILNAVRREIEALEEKLAEQILRVQRHCNTRVEEALDRVHAVVHVTDAMQVKQDQRLAELGGNYRALWEEMQTQVRRIAKVDSGLTDHHQRQEEVRIKTHELEQRQQKLSASMNARDNAFNEMLTRHGQCIQILVHEAEQGKLESNIRLELLHRIFEGKEVYSHEEVHEHIEAKALVDLNQECIDEKNVKAISSDRLRTNSSQSFVRGGRSTTPTPRTENHEKGLEHTWEFPPPSRPHRDLSRGVRCLHDSSTQGGMQ